MATVTDFIVKNGLQIANNLVVGTYTLNSAPVSNGAIISGNVGIGTTSVDSNVSLQVIGSLGSARYYMDDAGNYPSLAPSLNLNFVSGTNLDSRLTFTRASSATVTNAAGQLTSVDVNNPRFDFDSSYTPARPRGLLIEEARTNAIKNSAATGAAPADGVERTSNNFNGWTINLNGGTGSAVLNVGSAVLTGDGTKAASIYEAISVTAYNLYTILITTDNPVTIQCGGSIGSANTLAVTSVSAGTNIPFSFRSGSFTGTLYFQINNTTTTPATISSLSIKSAGTYPSTWAMSASQNGLQQQIVNVGYEDGIPFVDIRYWGTALSNLYLDWANFTLYNEIATSTGTTHYYTLYIRLIAGSLSGMNPPARMGFYLWTGAGAYIASSGMLTTTPTSAALRTQRYGAAYYISTANVGFIQPYLTMQMLSGQAIDCTLRFGLPQLEVGNFATSPILTTGAAATRSAEVISMPTNAWYNQQNLSVMTEGLRTVSNSTGNITTVEFNDTTTNNRISLAMNSNTNVMTWGDFYSTNLADARVLPGNIVLGSNYKCAATINNSNIAAALNGNVTSLSTLSNYPGTAVNTLSIGSSVSSNYLNGWLRSLSVWPVALSTSQLSNMTKT